MQYKKGLSDVVNSVLLTVIIIVAISVIGIFVFTFLLDNSISLSDMNLNIQKVEAFYNNQPVESQVYTSWESGVIMEYKETMYVSVERGTDSTNLTGLNFIFSVDGNSYSCIRRTVPGNLESHIYAFKSSIFNKKPDEVEVVPIAFINKKERVAKSGFVAEISEVEKTFSEKVNECDGFCCEANPELPPYPDTP
jgi:hypothetical protein